MLRPIGALKFERVDPEDRMRKTRTASIDALEMDRNKINERNFNFQTLGALEYIPVADLMPPLNK